MSNETTYATNEEDVILEANERPKVAFREQFIYYAVGIIVNIAAVLFAPQVAEISDSQLFALVGSITLATIAAIGREGIREHDWFITLQSYFDAKRNKTD